MKAERLNRRRLLKAALVGGAAAVAVPLAKAQVLASHDIPRTPCQSMSQQPDTRSQQPDTRSPEEVIEAWEKEELGHLDYSIDTTEVTRRYCMDCRDWPEHPRRLLARMAERGIAPDIRTINGMRCLIFESGNVWILPDAVV